MSMRIRLMLLAIDAVLAIWPLLVAAAFFATVFWAPYVVVGCIEALVAAKIGGA